MEALGYLNAQPDDDRAFLLVAARLVAAIEQPFELLSVIRVRNWFDHKWLRYSGLGRIPFEHILRSHPGVSLDTFYQDKLTFPPFTPQRIVVEERFAHEREHETSPIHLRRRRHSAENLQRRVTDYADSMLAMWISTATEPNGRGSIMAYLKSPRTEPDAWYASFNRHPTRWQLERVKGIGRKQVLDWLEEPPPTSSVVLVR